MIREGKEEGIIADRYIYIRYLLQIFEATIKGQIAHKYLALRMGFYNNNRQGNRIDHIERGEGIRI